MLRGPLVQVLDVAMNNTDHINFSNYTIYNEKVCVIT